MKLPDTCGTGSAISLNCVLGNDSALIASTGPWAAAMPFMPRNRDSPYSSVCWPARSVRLRSAISNCPKMNASISSARSPMVRFVPWGIALLAPPSTAAWVFGTGVLKSLWSRV
ncbi:hypothetical protein D3C87_1827950 [compost metagenome]